MARAAKGQVKELIGRAVVGDAQASIYKSRATVKTVDETVPDYAFYDKLRRGKAKGYTLGGLFCARIEQIFAAWVLGGGFVVTLADDDAQNETRAAYTNAELADFVAGMLDAGQDDEEADPDRDDAQGSLLLGVYRDALGLGDQYVVINADGSLSVASPETVTVERAPLDYRKVLAVKIETRLNKFSITDEYRADARTVTIKEGGKVVQEATYQNLIGRIPVVHVAHGRSGNETNGHSIHEPLKPLYDQYDDVAYKQLDGAKLLGNPILYFAGMEDINAVINANDPATAETYTDTDGSTQTRQQLNIDQNAVMLIGKGGSVGFAAPPVGFTKDTAQALQTLFWLLLDHTGIPEFIWGNEIASGRASSETQLDQFIADIKGRQRDAGGWILRLCKIWLQTQALIDPQIVVGRLQIKWPSVRETKKEILIKLIETALANDLLTPETALRLMDLVNNPGEEVEEAQKQADARREAMFPEGTSAQFQGRLGATEDTEDAAEEGDGA